ncbi:terpene synthase family protein [Amycolatopsis speibonae]|uniref:Terpene synthase n=1 Tax=Amycolatopsis speibonae TaxID=1450224 RepID=A0ABV7P5S8_9PSEU
MLTPQMQIPQFYCPIQCKIHPAWRDVDESSVRWLLRYFGEDAETRRYATGRMGMLAAMAAPQAIADRLQIYADFLMWLAVFDDGVIEEGDQATRPRELAARLRILLRVAEAPEFSRADDPVAESLRDIRRRLGNCASATQTARWVSAMRGYFFDQVYRAHLCVSRTIPTLEDYTLLRIYDTSMGVDVAMLDIISGYEITGSEVESAGFRALSELTCLLVGWDNDIISYQKEKTRAPSGQNVIDVLVKERNISLDEALMVAMRLRDRLMHRFVTLRDQIQPNASAPALHYLQDLASWIVGNLEWGMRSNRYRKISNGDFAFTVDEPARHRSAAVPADLVDGPLDFPAISWWWQPELATGGSGSPIGA